MKYEKRTDQHEGTKYKHNIDISEINTWTKLARACKKTKVELESWWTNWKREFATDGIWFLFSSSFGDDFSAIITDDSRYVELLFTLGLNYIFLNFSNCIMFIYANITLKHWKLDTRLGLDIKVNFEIESIFILKILPLW